MKKRRDDGATRRRLQPEAQQASERSNTMETAIAEKSVTTNGSRVHSLIEEVKAGVAKVQSSTDWTKYLEVCSRFWSYSFHNQLLIAIQCPNATRVAGFNAWKKLNRWVRKGEHGIHILAPMVAKAKPENGRGSAEADYVVRGFKSVCVFDVAQTEGESLTTLDGPLCGDAPEGKFDALKKFIEDAGYTVTFRKVAGTAYGFVNGRKEIVLKEGEDTSQSLATLCHEVSHALLGHVGNAEISKEDKELEAETAAWIICRNLGLETSKSSFGYLATWAPTRDRDARLEKAAQRACEVAKRVLSALNPDFGDLDG